MFRSRYLLAVLLHVTLALVASARAHRSGAEILARCGSGPSFAGTTELKRWPGFPVDVFVDIDSLPRDSRDAYRAGITQGVRLWSQATSGRIGAFRVRFDRPDAPVRIRVVPGPLPESAIGSTELHFTDSRIVAANVQLTRSRFESTDLLVADLASTTAHEMGHVLGIVDHSPFPEDKMWVSGNFAETNRNRDPASLLTERDVHTLEEAYCRPFEMLTAESRHERRAQTSSQP